MMLNDSDRKTFDFVIISSYTIGALVIRIAVSRLCVDKKGSHNLQLKIFWKFFNSIPYPYSISMT